MTLRTDGQGTSLPSLDSTFSKNEVSMDLTMCGLLVEKAEEMAKLYATHRDWTSVEDRWFEERRDDRSTRGSSRKIYRVLSSRFKTADRSLPAISRLPSIFDLCGGKRDKAQVLYFYLIEDDPLVKFVVHEYVRRLQERGVDGLGSNWPQIREEIITRDNESCLRCGMGREAHREEFGRDLPVHHRIPRRRFYNDPDRSVDDADVPSNLLTLCIPCHRRIEQMPVQPVVE